MELKKILHFQIILRNNESSVQFPDFRLHYKAIMTRTLWFWHKKYTHSSTEQNREPRNKAEPMVKYFLTKFWEHTMGERRVSSTNTA